MNICKKSVRACLLLTVLSLALSGRASALTDLNALPEYFSPGRLNIPRYISYRGLDYTFDENFSIAKTVPSTASVFVGDSQQHVISPAAYAREFFPDIIDGAGRIFSLDNLPLALIGTGLAGLAVTIDHPTKNYFQKKRPLDGISTYGDTIGQAYYHVAVGAAFFGVGELTDNPKLAETGEVILQSLLVNCIATEGLKYATERLRPNGGDHMSFPSGHASSTAALAASISEMYDWRPIVSIPLYATVVFVGASRIQDNEHYLSDVIAGITLGTIIGRSFAKYHKEKNGSTGSARFSFSPVLEKDLKGGIFTMKW